MADRQKDQNDGMSGVPGKYDEDIDSSSKKPGGLSGSGASKNPSDLGSSESVGNKPKPTNPSDQDIDDQNTMEEPPSPSNR